LDSLHALSIVAIHHGSKLPWFSLTRLNKANQEKKSTLVLVYLPEFRESFEQSSSWRKWLSEETAKRKIIFFDLFENLNDLTIPELESLFIKDNWHYSRKGNKFVADILYKRLLSQGLLIPNPRIKLTPI
jgi:lysophospholipase L1-like esterase